MGIACDVTACKNNTGGFCDKEDIYISDAETEGNQCAKTQSLTMRKIKVWRCIMNRINLPQTIQCDDLTVTQATNCHVSICKDGRKVFHSPVDRPLDFDGLMKLVKMYKTMMLRAPEPYRKEE